MKLTTGEIHSLFTALTHGLDGYDGVIVDAKGEQKQVRHMFELGAVRLDIAVNANKLKPIVRSLEEARNSLIKGLAGGKGEMKQEDNPEGFSKLEADILAMLSVEHDVDLKPLKRSSLKLDINPISVPILMILESSGLLVE